MPNTMTQTTIFDFEKGDRLLHEALTRAAAHADPNWIEDALRAVHQVAKTTHEFTSADIWNAGLAKPEEPRRIGNVMRMACMRGWIEATGRTRKSEIPSQHRQPLGVWRSLIVRKGEM